MAHHSRVDRWPAWLFLRALGFIFATAFLSLWTQIHGLVGPQGIFPAREFLDEIARDQPGLLRFWEAPSLLWISSGDAALDLLCALGFLAGLALTFDIFPRSATAIATLAYLSFIAVAQIFARYQSDGMLLEAGLLSFFLAHPQANPRIYTEYKNAASPSGRRQLPLWQIALWLLRWEWFRLYFESGIVKWFGGDPQWHALTALDTYYENGPLPTWLAWYAQQEMPHAFHAACAAFTLLIENLGPLVLFLPWRNRWCRRIRLVAIALCTLLQLGILLTANYAFINHMALALGILMLDDEAIPQSWKERISRFGSPRAAAKRVAVPIKSWRANLQIKIGRMQALLLFAAMFWTTLVLFPFAPLRRLPDVALEPARALQPFRIANRFGLFGRMTEARYELEFQGSLDGVHWLAYPFKRKPQDVQVPPAFYAPHQPRFDWNLWFSSLGSWRSDEGFTLRVCRGLLEGNRTIAKLFAGDPFEHQAPSSCRIVRYQYWFASKEEHAKSGAWWRRKELGVWAPVMSRKDGELVLEPQDGVDDGGAEPAE